MVYHTCISELVVIWQLFFSGPDRAKLASRFPEICQMAKWPQKCINFLCWIISPVALHPFIFLTFLQYIVSLSPVFYPFIYFPWLHCDRDSVCWNWLEMTKVVVFKFSFQQKLVNWVNTNYVLENLAKFLLFFFFLPGSAKHELETFDRFWQFH